jgi:hypothetical protein
MSSDLDSIDYSSIHSEVAPSKKQTGITTRKFENKTAEAAPVDIGGVVQRAADMQQSMGAPTPAAGFTNYGLEALGTLGALGAAYQAWKGRQDQPKGPVQPTTQDEIARMKLERERLKTEKAQVQHENFLRENTLSPVEQALGRKAKDPTELGILNKLYDQEVAAGRIQPYEGYVSPKAAPVTAAPVVNTTPAPVSQVAAPIVPTPETIQPVANTPIVEPPVAETPAAKQIATTTPTTPNAVVQAVEKKEPVVAADKPLSKAKKAISPEDAGLTKQELGMKKHLLEMYGVKDSPVAAEKAYATVKEILGYTPAYPQGKGGSLNPEEKGKVLSYRKENIEGPKVNLDKDMKRALKSGAGLGVLMAIPGFADAAQKKDYGRMADLASDFVVPPFAGSTELGVSTLGEKQMKAFENAQKLGSPYRSVPPR